MFPNQAQIYKQVIDHGLPNYMGARLSVPHQINIANWRQMQYMLPDQQLVDFLQYGFPVGYCAPHPPTTQLPNHSSATANPDHVLKYINTECNKDAMLGPFSSSPFIQWTRLNPMMTRPKRDSSELRVILDMSF